METKTVNKSDETSEVTALHSAAIPADALPARVMLAPWGAVESVNGSFIVDEESVRLAIEAFDEHGTDLPLDYEHQTLGGSYASPNGKAPAAGWIKRITAETGVGLFADIEWTEPARELIRTKQYRYLSPVAIVRKTDRKLVAIHSAALTNKPAIVAMKPIVNRADAHVGSVVFAEGAAHPLELLRAELRLPSTTATEEILVAAGRRLCELKRHAERRLVEQRIREAVRSGRLVEAQRAWAERLAARDEALFDEWFRTAPVLLTPGAITAAPLADTQATRQRATAARAKAEYRSHPLLSRLTTQEAYIADALRAEVLRAAAHCAEAIPA